MNMERDNELKETQRIIRQQVLDTIDVDRIDGLMTNRIALLREIIVIVQQICQATNR